MKQDKFSIAKRIKSFGYAFNGLQILVREEHNFWLHLFAALCVVLAGIAFHISLMEWIAVVFCIGFVIALEIINTAIENMADFISPQKDEKIKRIKDLSAAATLVGAVVAAIVGLIIFIPKIIELC